MELSLRQKNLAAAAVLLGMFLAAVEATVVATSMPSAVKALGGLPLIHYVFVSYQLATAITIVSWGKLTDRWGLRKSYLLGCSIFLVGSAVCGAVNNIYQLIAGRFLQGIGAAAIYPVAQTTLGALFTHEKRAKMQVYGSLVWAFASIAGPPLGAVITEHFSWRWVFYLNLPAGLFSLALFTKSLAHYKDGSRETQENFDYPGALLFAGATFLFILATAVDKTGHFILPVKSMAIVVFLAAIFAVVFTQHINDRNNAFISPHLVKNSVFQKAGSGSFFMSMAMFGTIAFIPLIAQLCFGQSVLQAGKTLTFLILGWMSASVVSSRLYLKWGLSRIARLGMGVLCLIYAIMALMSQKMNIAGFRLSLFFLGTGMGICFVPLLLGVQASLTRKELASGTATLQFSRTLGGTFGVSILGTILVLSLKHNSTPVSPAALVEFFLAGALMGLAALVCVWKLPSEAPRAPPETENY